jgi:hypothetical protein
MAIYMNIQLHKSMGFQWLGFISEKTLLIKELTLGGF